MCIDHRRTDILVAEQFLYGTDIVSTFEQVRGEGVAEGVAGSVFRQFCLADSPFDGVLQVVFEDVVATDKAGAWIRGAFRCGEDVLPSPLFCGVGILAFEGIRKMDRAVALHEVLPMQSVGDFELGSQGSVQAGREHGHAVFVTFALANGELVLSEVNVLDAQPYTLHEAQAGTIEQARPIRALRHEPFCSRKVAQNRLDFGASENNRQAFGAFRPLDALDPGQSDLQHIAIEEEKCIEGDVLCGGGDGALDGKVSKVVPDFRNTKSQRVFALMEAHIITDDTKIALLRAVGVVCGGWYPAPPDRACVESLLTSVSLFVILAAHCHGKGPSTRKKCTVFSVLFSLCRSFTVFSAE